MNTNRKTGHLPAVSALALLALTACAASAQSPEPEPGKAFVDALDEKVPEAEAEAKAEQGQDDMSDAPAVEFAGRKIQIIGEDGSVQDIEIRQGTVVIATGDGEVRTLGKGHHRLELGEDGAEIDIEVFVEEDDKETGDRNVRIVRRGDGDRLFIIDMDKIRRDVERGVERAKERAERMHGRAMEHVERMLDNMENTYRFTMTFDEEKLSRMMEALRDSELRLRKAFDDEWREGLSRELEALEKELEKLEREQTELAELDTAEREEVLEARRRALEEAREELAKAEEIRREALAQAAEELRAARERLRERREMLERELKKNDVR